MTRFHFQERQLDESQLLELIFAKNEKSRDNAFWSELSECDENMPDISLNLYLASAVPLRPIVAVYHHVRRSHHPLKLQGQWKEHEDDLLTQYTQIFHFSYPYSPSNHRAVADLGQQWEKVSFRVGRMASDCRDRYRNHIINREIRVSGSLSFFIFFVLPKLVLLVRPLVKGRRRQADSHRYRYDG